MQPRKCQLFRKTVNYLGHVISENQIAPDTKKIDKIREWPFPQTGHDMASFLGLCNYYRKLIPKMAEYAASLYQSATQTIIDETLTLRKDFDSLKQAACNVPTMRIPNPKLPFILETDASNIALGAVLKQN